MQKTILFSASEIHALTLLAAKNEKSATLVLLEQLMIVEEKRVYAIMGYSSLWEYVHKELKYSEPQTSERVSAMRLMKRVPEVKKELEAGKLTLTTTAKLATHVKREQCSESEVLQLLESVSGKTTREAERVLVQGSNETAKPDQVRVVTKDLTRITIEVDSDFLELMKRAKELGGHTGSSPQELFKMGLAEFVKKREIKDSSRKQTSQKVKKPAGAQEESSSETKISTHSAYIENEFGLHGREVTKDEAQLKSELKTRSRYTPKPVKIYIRQKSQDQCEFISPETGKRCECKIGLQFEHVEPFSVGGKQSIENLKHYCATHNRLSAIQFFGEEKMKKFLGNNKQRN